MACVFAAATLFASANGGISPASADNYPAVGHLLFEPRHLRPYSDATFDAHCEATAEQLCSAAHDSEDTSYRATLLRKYCTTDQYEKCVLARSLITRR